MTVSDSDVVNSPTINIHLLSLGQELQGQHKEKGFHARTLCRVPLALDTKFPLYLPHWYGIVAGLEVKLPE